MSHLPSFIDFLREERKSAPGYESEYQYDPSDVEDPDDVDDSRGNEDLAALGYSQEPQPEAPYTDQLRQYRPGAGAKRQIDPRVAAAKEKLFKKDSAHPRFNPDEQRQLGKGEWPKEKQDKKGPKKVPSMDEISRKVASSPAWAVRAASILTKPLPAAAQETSPKITNNDQALFNYVSGKDPKDIDPEYLARLNKILPKYTKNIAIHAVQANTDPEELMKRQSAQHEPMDPDSGVFRGGTRREPGASEPAWAEHDPTAPAGFEKSEYKLDPDKGADMRNPEYWDNLGATYTSGADMYGKNDQALVDAFMDKMRDYKVNREGKGRHPFSYGQYDNFSTAADKFYEATLDSEMLSLKQLEFLKKMMSYDPEFREKTKSPGALYKGDDKATMSKFEKFAQNYAKLPDPKPTISDKDLEVLRKFYGQHSKWGKTLSDKQLSLLKRIMRRNKLAIDMANDHKGE